jgi:hypothetical protein
MADNGLDTAHNESTKKISGGCVSAHEDLTKGIFEECIGLLKVVGKFPLASEMLQVILDPLGPSRRVRRCTKRITHSLLQLIGLSLKIAIFERDSFPYYFSTTCMTMDLAIHQRVGKMASLDVKNVDTCVACGFTVDGQCFKGDVRTWHAKCLRCSHCGKLAAFLDDTTSKHPALLRECRFCGEVDRAYPVTASLQRRHLLWVALARVMSARRIEWNALSRVSIGE